MTYYDPPLPWETAEMHAAQQACCALVDRATDGRDTVEALAWLSQCVADSETRADALGTLQARLTEDEWPTYLAWRTGAAAYLVPAMVGKHARRVALKAAA